LLRGAGSVQDKIDRAESGKPALKECDTQNSREEKPEWINRVTKGHT
jgi:hypothetical protein